MKRAAILLTLTALLAFAPSAFACWRCNTTEGCYGVPVGTPGWVDCEFNGTCRRIGGFCQGFSDESELAASYTVAAVHVVETETAKTPDVTVKVVPETQEVAKVAAER